MDIERYFQRPHVAKISCSSVDSHLFTKNVYDCKAEKWRNSGDATNGANHTHTQTYTHFWISLSLFDWIRLTREFSFYFPSAGIRRWNQKCRSRVFTLGDVVTVLNKYHTHEDVIHRKKRVAKKRSDDDKDFADVDYLLTSTDKKDASEDEDGIFCVAFDSNE